jgi:DNA-binding transcriptional LysR family regulator
MMQDLNDLYFFVQVVDHGGFVAAERAIGVQKSKLSRRILQLEDRLGVRLLNRGSPGRAVAQPLLTPLLRDRDRPGIL